MLFSTQKILRLGDEEGEKPVSRNRICVEKVL